MASPSKTAGTVALAHQAVSHPGTVVGSALDVSTKFRATIFLDHAIVEETANTDPASWLIQASAFTSGDEEWVTLLELPLTETGTPATEAMTATEPSGETVMAVASTTGFVAGDIIYLLDAGTLADSEWSLVQEIVSNVSIDLLDGLTTGKDSSDVIWGSAQRDIIPLNVESFVRLRVVYFHEGATAANSHIRATMTTEDSVA